MLITNFKIGQTWNTDYVNTSTYFWPHFSDDEPMALNSIDDLLLQFNSFGFHDICNYPHMYLDLLGYKWEKEMKYYYGWNKIVQK